MPKKVFVSFDYENDKNYKFLLEAWDKNKNIDFEFDDFSSGEINSNNISVVKTALSTKINKATYTLVIVGKEANKKHKDSDAIGYKNWQNFEIAKSKEYGNKLVAVKLSQFNSSPEELLSSGVLYVNSFNQDSIIEALKKI